MGDSGDVIGAGSLKLIIGASPTRALSSLIVASLRDRGSNVDIRELSAHAVLVFSDAPVDALRARVSPHLQSDENVLVVEFERWSSYGAAVDTRWLSRRGH